MTTFAPRTADEATEAIRWALAAGEALEVVGSGSKRALGRPVDAPHLLDVSALSGIVSYEPAELVLTALAGTPMRVIEAALAEHSQWLACEPPDLGPLLAGPIVGSASRADVIPPSRTMENAIGGITSGGSPLPATGTLGGAVATGLSGPRRFKAGAVRDHILGMAAVSGRGEAFVGGGKVVKNVTGYDIPKLMTGSYGTLAVLTEITMKVLPAPERVSTVLVAGLSVRDGVRAMTDTLQSALDVSGVCHLPAGVSVRGGLIEASVTAFRLEGFACSVESRLQSLRKMLGAMGSLSLLDGEEAALFWRDVRDVGPLVDAGALAEASSVVRGASADAIWRISVPPTEGASVVERIQQLVPGTKMFLDWGGGLIWLAAPAGAGVREALGETGGHATLMRAPAAVRANVHVFQPQAAPVAALSKRLKAQFDPARVLNPGRMYADI